MSRLKRNVILCLTSALIIYDIILNVNCENINNGISPTRNEKIHTYYYNNSYIWYEGHISDNNSSSQIIVINNDINNDNILSNVSDNKNLKKFDNIQRNVKINHPKYFNHAKTQYDDIKNNNLSFVKKSQENKSKEIFNIDNIKKMNKDTSTSSLIDMIHHAREKTSKNFGSNKKYHNNYEKDFPADWYRILGDGKRKKENIFFYEVPLIDVPDVGKKMYYKNAMIGISENKKDKTENFEINQSVYKKRKSKIVTEDEFVFDPEKPIINDAEDEGLVFERFLNIFQIVTFNNKDCYSSNGVKGICLHPFECQTTSGIATGSCAEGYGICCIYQYSCGDQTSSNCSTFTNPNFPKQSTDRLSCTFTVNKAYPGVTQLHLEIIQLELYPPTNGSCVEDQFVITGHNINSIVPILCGINNGQHLYVEVGESSGPFYISVMSSKAAERLIQVRICQIGPGDHKAPQGCLQYHKYSTGFIESFNYRADGSIPGYRKPGYTNNLNYAICIARAPNSCSITYKNFDENGDFEFQISNFDSDGTPLLPPGQAGVEIFNCPDDYIVVNGIRLCGERLNDASLTEDFTINAPVTETSAGPIVFIFRTNGNGVGRGFRLAYRQNPCTVFGFSDKDLPLN